jgi:drebrin-like protein
VQLPTPKKLVNPFAARAAEAASTASRSAVPSSPGTNKLTWSERQAQAKKQKEEEDQRSQEASTASIRSFGTTSGLRYGAGAVAAGATAAVSAAYVDEIDKEPAPVEAEEPVQEEFIAPPAPPPPPPPPPPPLPVVSVPSAPWYPPPQEESEPEAEVEAVAEQVCFLHPLVPMPIHDASIS